MALQYIVILLLKALIAFEVFLFFAAHLLLTRRAIFFRCSPVLLLCVFDPYNVFTGKIGVNSGIHAWEFIWEGPLGTVACVGLATMYDYNFCILRSSPVKTYV